MSIWVNSETKKHSAWYNYGSFWSDKELTQIREDYAAEIAALKS